ILSQPPFSMAVALSQELTAFKSLSLRCSFGPWLNCATQIAARAARSAWSVICWVVPRVVQPPQLKPTIIATPAPRIRPQAPYFTFTSVSGFTELASSGNGGGRLWHRRKRALCALRNTLGVGLALVARCAPRDPGLAIPAFGVPALLGALLHRRRFQALFPPHPHPGRSSGEMPRHGEPEIEERAHAKGTPELRFVALVFHAARLTLCACGARVCAPARSGAHVLCSTQTRGPCRRTVPSS